MNIEPGVKIYNLSQDNKKEDIVSEGMHRFCFYEVCTKSDMLKKFRDEFIKSLNGNVFCKIISSDASWFYYQNGIYDVDKEMGKKFFELNTLPINYHDKSSLLSFINHGPYLNDMVKCVKYDGKFLFFYTYVNNMTKRGRNYSVLPVIEISEDVYNLSKIQFRDFGSLTVDDLSKYSEFFRVSDTPYYIVDEARIEDMYRTGNISRDEYKSKIESYKKEEELVMSLRKK